VQALRQVADDPLRKQAFAGPRLADDGQHLAREKFDRQRFYKLSVISADFQRLGLQ
jgi:hypothetical protein